MKVTTVLIEWSNKQRSIEYFKSEKECVLYFNTLEVFKNITPQEFYSDNSNWSF